MLILQVCCFSPLFILRVNSICLLFLVVVYSTCLFYTFAVSLCCSFILRVYSASLLFLFVDYSTCRPDWLTGRKTSSYYYYFSTQPSVWDCVDCNYDWYQLHIRHFDWLFFPRSDLKTAWRKVSCLPFLVDLDSCGSVPEADRHNAVIMPFGYQPFFGLICLIWDSSDNSISPRWRQVAIDRHNAIIMPSGCQLFFAIIFHFCLIGNSSDNLVLLPVETAWERWTHVTLWFLLGFIPSLGSLELGHSYAAKLNHQ